ncbi:hypothetical protein EDB86DRAFT_3076749 [Lactarius hatsudake]|nr:hypothetical protein EDB86DRAFT_3076749 [Lactarius hatsudake]
MRTIFALSLAAFAFAVPVGEAAGNPAQGIGGLPLLGGGGLPLLGGGGLPLLGGGGGGDESYWCVLGMMFPSVTVLGNPDLCDDAPNERVCEYVSLPPFMSGIIW